PCFTGQEASDIANNDQGTDEDPKTWPGPGWYAVPGDKSQAGVPRGLGGWIIQTAYGWGIPMLPNGVPTWDNSDYRQQWQNAYYHALHPGAAEGVGNPDLWNQAMKECNVSKEFGQYLHYLQDTFAHSGYTSPNCGHGCAVQHKADHTIVDPDKALRA